MIDSWKHCRLKKGLEIHGWCIMSSHIHMINGTHGENQENIMRDMKKHTSIALRQANGRHPAESRKEWMLWMMKRAGSKNNHNSDFQLWQQDNHPIDTMKKQILISVILLVGLISKQTKAQVIKVQSFDGKEQTITVSPDYDRDHLTVATLIDTLHIENCTEVEEAIALNKNFVKIIYQVRGGSGIHLRHMIILTSKNDKLYQSLHITSLFNEEYIDFSKKPVSTQPAKSSRYEVKISPLNSDYRNKMIVSIYKEEKSKDHPQNDYNKESNNTLIFDTAKNVFYSSNVDISQYFTIYDPKTQQESKQYLMGTFLTVQLGDYNYYYMKGEWYEKGHNDSLSKYAYK
jgi:REP element-mobilizing transposase RayT